MQYDSNPIKNPLINNHLRLEIRMDLEFEFLYLMKIYLSMTIPLFSPLVVVQI